MQQLAPSNTQAALLAAEGLRLQSILSAHQLNLVGKLSQCLQSVLYARYTSNPNTLAASLHELTAAYRYLRQQEAILSPFQEMLSFCEQVSPSLRANIYAGAAAAFAYRQRKQEAFFYMRLAYETFPDHPESDPPFLSADNGLCH